MRAHQIGAVRFGTRSCGARWAQLVCGALPVTGPDLLENRRELDVNEPEEQRRASAVHDAANRFAFA